VPLGLGVIPFAPAEALFSPSPFGGSIRFTSLSLSLFLLPSFISAQNATDGPTNEKAQKTYKEGGIQGLHRDDVRRNRNPHTFTIDADGVLQEEHIGDASIEGKLKKLIAQARELQATGNSPK
jgi:hypothetical protein